MKHKNCHRVFVFLTGLILLSIIQLRGQNFGASGDCHINAWCEPSWCNEIRSVALMRNIGCSGTLIMNTNGDFRPYFLTAFHCLDTDNNQKLSEQEKAAVANEVFIFNYELSPNDCKNDENEPIDTMVIRGARWIADQRKADMVLLELSRRPDIDWNVTYAGWDARDKNISAKHGVGVHHPARDVKKINRYKLNPTKLSIKSETLGWIKVWRVNWTRGTTEGGSSGSPLYNEKGRVIGILNGSSLSTCNNLKESKYGRFGVAWKYNSQLRNSLAPGSGRKTMDFGEPCQQEIDLSNAWLATHFFEGRYDAVHRITAGANTFLRSQETASFNAGEIVLKPGFHAREGSEFTANINPCTRGYGCPTANTSLVTLDEESDDRSKLQNQPISQPLLVYPNPASEQLTIAFELSQPSPVHLQIVDLQGRVVEKLIEGINYNTGQHKLDWTIQALPNGMYLARIVTDEKADVVPFSIVK